jgi:hypothetical protein
MKDAKDWKFETTTVDDDVILSTDHNKQVTIHCNYEDYYELKKIVERYNKSQNNKNKTNQA